MRYADIEMMVQRFGRAELLELSDRDGSGELNEAVIEAALSDACADIDGYIGGRYQLPLTTVAPVLHRSACDLARYYLYDNRLDEQHPAARRYKAVIRLLEQISKGQVLLGIDQSADSASHTDTVQIESCDTVFNRAAAKGFI